MFPFRRVLRKTKINELPQLVNIFQGDMTIIGPRPQIEVDFWKFSNLVRKIFTILNPVYQGLVQLLFELSW